VTATRDRALITEPKCLILDEPIAGIQQSVVHELGGTITPPTERGNLGDLLVEEHIGFALEAAPASLTGRFGVRGRRARRMAI